MQNIESPAPTVSRLSLPKILERLLEVPEGWATDTQLSFDVGGDDLPTRREVRSVIGSLARNGVLSRFTIRHNAKTFGCYFLDHDAIRSYTGGDR